MLISNIFALILQPIPAAYVPIQLKTESDLSSISGKSAGGLNSMYLGFSGKIPSSAKIDFRKNLSNMWNRKLSINGVSGATEKSYQIFLNRYHDDPGFTTYELYKEDIKDSIEEAKVSINFTKLCKKMKIKNCVSFASAAMSINENHILAYSMTEIMPSQNGEFNKKFLSILLNEAGTNFINGIPALGDTYLSVGPYQFTSYAIRDGEGANVVAKYSSLKIPGSVVKLEGNDHHVAAYYFAVYNLARLSKKIEIKKQCRGDALVPFISTAHHMPSVAINRAKEWIKHECDRPLEDYLGPKLGTYAKKTRINLKAIA